ncbi:MULTISPECIES: helix-turn-helix domain-containing protein [Halostella]|uniref:winged helix-turn-helix domain-containing protein n=1 Tax=Halostella TaxID=1843185 RepID=UPI00108089B9|nr:MULTISPECIES: helix-turn-helix domain-containing protein [Halostella]
MAATKLGTDETDSHVLLSALGSKYSVEILHATQSPTSAQKLSDELDVPIATCYRRIEELVDAGLLECEGRKLSEEGRRTNVYRRTLDELSIDLTPDAPTITREERSEAKNHIQDQIDRE